MEALAKINCSKMLNLSIGVVHLLRVLGYRCACSITFFFLAVDWHHERVRWELSTRW